jgi:hypothetical protein
MLPRKEGKKEMIVSRAMHGNAFCSRFDADAMQVEITAVHGFDNNPIMPEPLELDAYDLRQFIEALQRLDKAFNEALEADVTSTLAAQGIKYVTPPSPKPSMEEEIEELYGKRCPDYEPSCACCDAWHAYDVGAYSCVRADIDQCYADEAADEAAYEASQLVASAYADK